jgi:hypothetical protein
MKLTDGQIKGILDGYEGVTPGKRYIGAQNDALYLIVGRAPSPDNDCPMHDADRTPLAHVYDEAEGRRLAQLDPNTIRSAFTELLESRAAIAAKDAEIERLAKERDEAHGLLNANEDSHRATEARVEQLEGSLSQAGKWFRAYGQGHDAKGDIDKAKRNHDRADFCARAALGPKP